ncbi:MAG: Gfo/Idh/MocA family oxidoreductase [Bacteroidota bacterium]
MKLRWGILGPGKIANKFVKDLLLIDDCELASVASRSLEKAENFARIYGAKHFYSSYKDLFEDKDIDIIYIATPHNSHMKFALEALNHGKHVLCEKPLAINKEQVSALIHAARTNNVFLMEAFWTRFNPTMEAVLSKIKNDEIGEVNYINADFCFYKDADPDSRLFNLELAGGALLDVGVYPIFLSYMIMGYPEDILATALLHKTGADLQTSAILKYNKGLSTLNCGFRSHSDMVAKIYGTGGKIFIDDRWHESSGYRVEKDGEVQAFSHPTLGKGFSYEIQECVRCIQAGKIESEKWSHQDSLNLISICDEVRRQVGVKYPFE